MVDIQMLVNVIFDKNSEHFEHLEDFEHFAKYFHQIFDEFSYHAPKQSKWTSFGSKINICELIFKSAYQIFLNMYPIAEKKKKIGKITILNFSE